MTMDRVRHILRSSPAIYRVHGLVQYFRFQRNYRKAMQLHEKQCKDGTFDIPIPPPLLRHRVHGNFDEQSFLDIGHTCATDIKTLVKSVGKDLYSFERVLDFGCGCGRILRFFHDHPPSCRFDALDIDAEMISWCRDNLAFLAEWNTTDHLPPTSFKDDTFSFIYVISLFSHLDEYMQFLWLEELRRIVKPGHYVILSFHGGASVAELTAADRSVFEKRGFLYKKGQTGKLKLDGLPDYYQFAINSEGYIYENWTKFFEVVDFVNRGIDNYQDVAILRKPSA